MAIKKQRTMENEVINKIADEIAKARLAFQIERNTIDGDLGLMVELAAAVGTRLIGKPYIVDSENRFVLENCILWLMNKPFVSINPITGKQEQGDANRGIYIAGQCGTGKSVLLSILAAVSNRFGACYDFGDEKNIRLVWKDQRTEEICNEFILNGAEVVNSAKTKRVLCLNDFGSESNEQVYMGNRVNAIRQIIESRGDQYGLFTIISSNFPIYHDILVQQYGDRVASRLVGMCNYFELKGADRRRPTNRS